MSTARNRQYKLSEETAAERVMLFHLTNTADGTNATGKTIAGADFILSKNGAAFGNAAGTVTELSVGWYTMAFAAADLGTAGDLAYVISESGCDTIRGVHEVVPLDAYVSPFVRQGTAQAGAANTITLDAGASATNDLYNDQVIRITGGTGAGQINLVTDYVGSTKVATVLKAWATNPDNTSVFALLGSGPVNQASIQADIDSLQTSMATVIAQTLPTETTFHVLGAGAAGAGVTDDGASLGLSLTHALDALITVAGTFDGATITGQVLDAGGNWRSLSGGASAALTAAGTIAVAAGIGAAGVRVLISSAGAGTDLESSVAIRSVAS
jgi:hypothetical protein